MKKYFCLIVAGLALLSFSPARASSEPNIITNVLDPSGARTVQLSFELSCEDWESLVVKVLQENTMLNGQIAKLQTEKSGVVTLATLSVGSLPQFNVTGNEDCTYLKQSYKTLKEENKVLKAQVAELCNGNNSLLCKF